MPAHARLALTRTSWWLESDLARSGECSNTWRCRPALLFPVGNLSICVVPVRRINELEARQCRATLILEEALGPDAVRTVDLHRQRPVAKGIRRSACGCDAPGVYQLYAEPRPERRDAGRRSPRAHVHRDHGSAAW